MEDDAGNIFIMGPTTIFIILLTLVCAALISGGGVYLAVRYFDKIKKADALTQAQIIVDSAKDEARRISERTQKDADELRALALKDADATRSRAQIDADNYRREAEIAMKEKAMRQKEEFEIEKREAERELSEKERLLTRRQETVERQATELHAQEKTLEATRADLDMKIKEQLRINDALTKSLGEQERKLYEVANLTKDEAKKEILDRLDKELTEEEGAIILKHERAATEKCQTVARNIILTAIQRYAAAHTSEATTSTVDIPNDDMKGRVIGREGRNIRAFERVTGADLVIDDTPGVIIVSAFDMVRREEARLTLSRLIADGRIHPARIEEVHKQTQKDVQEFIAQQGVEACEEANVRYLHSKLVHYLGRLCFRTRYSQNVLRHSVEVAFISGMIAAEMGLDEALARRCGLLHDIGKSIDHEVEGGHPKVGADLLRRCNEPPEVVDAALNHHEDPRITSPYTTIVAAADACSASRPGARRETLENYVRRMEEFEKIAKEFPCVDSAFAVQAGREIRVMVNPNKTSDEGAAKVCRDIVSALRERLTFSGEIKVTVIRETRATEVAK